MNKNFKSNSEGKTLLGSELSNDQLKAIQSISPTADQILNELDNLNEEIEEANNMDIKELPKTTIPKPTARGRKRRKNKKKEETMNLDEELASLDEKLNEEIATETTTSAQPPDMHQQILDLLDGNDNAPEKAEIEHWKAKYGQNAVHVMAFSESDIFIFTHLQRGQWKKIQELVAKAQEAGSKDVEDDLKEKVVQYCTLWPSLPVDFFYTSKAGVVDSLYQVILLNSYFLTPQQAMLLTTQL